MDTRELEQVMLARCLSAARSGHVAALSAQEANVFRVAAMLLQFRFPAPSARLMLASDSYLREHPADLLSASAVLHRGWVSSLPRLRDMLTEQFGRQERRAQ